MLIIVNKVNIQHNILDLHLFFSLEVPGIVDVVNVLHIYGKELFHEFHLLL